MNRTMARRWGDNDTYFGPFTFAGPTRGWKPTTIMLCSGDDEHPGASLRISIRGRTMIVALPGWTLRPERRWIDTSRYEWSGPGRGYWEISRREFGLTLSEGHLSAHFGRQTMDSSTQKSKGWFLPWTQWRHVRHSLYGLDGAHFADLPHRWGLGDGSWEERQRIADTCPTATFTFRDYDGEELTVATKIEEREWLRGTSWCKWLSLFVRPKISRSLDLRFSGETGKRKGSWKGGTIGHSIEMLPGELHEDAFRRYCPANGMTFVGTTSTGAPQ